MIRCLIVALTYLLATLAIAEPLQSWPGNTNDKTSVKAGAWLFARHCLACHGASEIDEDKLKTLGFSDQQLREEFSLSNDQAWRSAAEPEVLKQAFGVAPPDLSIFMRAQSDQRVMGADWIYSFLHSFIPDSKSPSGWNNTLRPGTMMPNVLYGLPNSSLADNRKAPVYGDLRPAAQYEFDKRVSDLVAYLVWMSGSGQKSVSKSPNSAQWNLGFVVVFLLGFLLVLVYALKRGYWKDVR